MSINYRPTQFGAPSHGTPADVADGGNKVLENLLTLGDCSKQMLGPGSGQAAAHAFAKAASSMTACDATTEKILPKLDFGKTGPLTALNGAEHAALPGGADIFSSQIADIASKMADPTGFIHLIMELLKSLCMQTENVMQLFDGMQPCEIYSIAAEAAKESAKRLAS